MGSHSRLACDACSQLDGEVGAETDLQDLNDRGSVGGDVSVGDHGSLGLPCVNKQDISAVWPHAGGRERKKRTRATPVEVVSGHRGDTRAKADASTA